MASRTRKTRRHQHGAALVEFAVIAPLLLALIFGIVEAGWALNQQLEVRHGAREGARLVAINHGTDAAIRNEICDQMHVAGDSAFTSVKIGTPGDRPFRRSPEVGDLAMVTVRARYDSLTGLLDGIFGAAGIDHSVEIRLEELPGAGLGTNATMNC